MKKIITAFFVISLFISSRSEALVIQDASTSSRNAKSVNALLLTKNTVTTGFQNSLSVPVGSIMAWPSKGGIRTPDAFKWRECNGQALLAADYQDLALVLGSSNGYITLPNLNNQFFRAKTGTSGILQPYTDQIKKHDQYITDPHVSSKLDNTSITSNLQTTTLSASLDDRSIKTQEKTVKNVTFTTTGKIKGQSFTGTPSWTASGKAKGQNVSTSETSIASIDNSTEFQFSGWDYQDHMQSGYKDDSPEPLIYDAYDSWDRWTTVPYTLKVNNGYIPVTLPSQSLANGSTSGTISGTTNASNYRGTSKGNITIPALSGALTSGNSEGYLDNGHANGTVTNGTAHGTFNSTDVKYTGTTNPYSHRDETAPKHIFVRYFIKVIP